MRWFESSRPSQVKILHIEIYVRSFSVCIGVVWSHSTVESERKDSVFDEEDVVMVTTEHLVHLFIDALRTGNVQKAVSFFTPDGFYQEAQTGPFIGHAAIRECLSSFVSLGRQWDFIIDDVLRNEHDNKAAVVYRFIIEGGSGEQFERAGCALVKRSGEQFAQWREYTG